MKKKTHFIIKSNQFNLPTMDQLANELLIKYTQHYTRALDCRPGLGDSSARSPF